MEYGLRMHLCRIPLSVAEHTIALINALAKCLFRVSTEFRKGNFEIRNQLKGNEYGGKTLGIIGVGRIGSLVAKKAALSIRHESVML